MLLPRRVVLFALLACAVVAPSCTPEGFFPDDVPRPNPDDPCSQSAPAGVCPEGETCRSGECLANEAFCSTANPAGVCARDDQRCVGGACIADADACAADNPDGECPPDLTCQNGVCASDQPCSPAERFGFCDAGLACLDGSCVNLSSLCGAANPGGLCPAGLGCDDGVCVPSDDLCGCTEGQTCLDGVCRDPSQLCSVDVPAGLCGGGAVCVAGACVDVGAGCSAQNPTGVCSPGSICQSGTCAAVDGAALCDDDNTCTVDRFDPARNRCENTPDDAASCDDGNACTTDSCSAGVCGGAPINGCVEPPTVNPVVSPTNVGQLVLSGQKPAGAAVEINDLVAVPESPDAAFSVTVNLVPGENIYRIKSVDQGSESAERVVRVVYDITAPITRVTPEGGAFISGVTATIASDEPATVFFTTDGTDPTETSSSFTSLKQLRIYADTTLKLRARDLAGNLETTIVTAQFAISARGSSWREPTGALPEGLAHAAAAFHAGFVFLVGGTDGLAPQAGAFRAAVDDVESWTTLPSLSGARSGLVLIANGVDLYAIGGENAGTPLNRVERLVGDGTAWELRAPMPSTRHALDAVVVDGSIFVFGGKTNGGAVLTNVEVYDVAANSWRNDVAQMPRPRAGFGAVLLDEKVYLVGGEGIGGAPVAEVDVYDIATDTWSTLAPLPTPRSFLGVGLLQNAGRVSSGSRGIVAAGGLLAGGAGSAVVEEYIVEDDRWVSRALLPAARHASAAVDVRVAGEVDNLEPELWMLGGQTGANLLTSSAAYAAPRDHVRRLTSLPEARFLHAAALLDDRIYLMGGRDFAEETTAWAFDPETGFYDELPPLPSVQSAPAAVGVGDRVYVMGGFDTFGNAVATLRAFDPVTRAWIELQPMTSGRGSPAATVVGEDIHVIGGENGGALPTVEIYNTRTNSWRAGPLLPLGRTGAMAVTHQGRVLVFGGEDPAGTVVSTVLARDGDGWTTLGGSVPVSFGVAAVTGEDAVLVVPGRFAGALGGAPFTYGPVDERVRTRPTTASWLGAPLDRRPGVMALGRLYLFGGNATDGVGPNGVDVVEEVEGRCFNGRVDGRESSTVEVGDERDGCPSLGFTLQGAIEACNAFHNTSACRNACGGSCTTVALDCSCDEIGWEYGNSSCFGGGAAGDIVQGCGEVIGTW